MIFIFRVFLAECDMAQKSKWRKLTFVKYKPSYVADHIKGLCKQNKNMYKYITTDQY